MTRTEARRRTRHRPRRRRLVAGSGVAAVVLLAGAGLAAAELRSSPRPLASETGPDTHLADVVTSAAQSVLLEQLAAHDAVVAAEREAARAEAAAQAEAEAAARAQAEAPAEAEAAAEAQAAEAQERATQEQEAEAPSSGHPSTGAPWRGGAGPDCGGPDSWEPPEGGGFFTSTPTEEGDGSNGRIPRADLTALDWCRDHAGNHQWLVPDAAAALTRLNAAFHDRFGENIAVDLSYRSHADQVAMREHYGSIAARPGTSNHGWGTAIDVWEWDAYAFGSERYRWLVENGPAYGWVAPDWARQDGSNPEYWHFEFVG